MRIRSILLLLTLLTLVSASVGGYLYISSTRSSFLQETEKKSSMQAVTMINRLSSFLSAHLKTIRVLAGIREIEEALSIPDETHILRANDILDKFKAGLEVDVCYLMDIKGNTLASSNRHAADSFVGKNFSFRPYFQQAMDGIPATYMALGAASNKRGAYYSYPVYDGVSVHPLGVVVIKASVDRIEKEFSQADDGIALMVDTNGIVFISSDKKWLFRSLWQLPPEKMKEIAESRQFGTGPWPWTGLTRGEGKITLDRQNNQYEIYQQNVNGFPGWQVVYLRNVHTGLFPIIYPIFKATGFVAVIFILLVATLVSILYHQASTELLQRKTAETALRESESRYRSLYHNTPALLQSIDPQGKLVSVSDYWLEIMGYSREEILGHNFTEYMPDSSRTVAETQFLPALQEKGSCNNLEIQFTKKNGELINVLLSAVMERDPEGTPIRFLVVLLDITEQKMTAEKLKIATEELSRYSKELERQVRERTREMSSILRYTPAIITLKDKFGRYLLASSRFEKLFGIEINTLRGKTDHEIFPQDLARIFRDNDRQVLTTLIPNQFEEIFPQQDGMKHTYLAIKFPLYDEEEAVSGVGSISTDITPLKKAQEQLRRLSENILTSHEKERTAVSRELHDELGQVLTALRLDAVWLQEKLGRTAPEAAARASSMRELIDKTIDEVRNLAVRLRSGLLDELGLIPALEWLTTDFEKRTGIACTFKHHDIPPVHDMTAMVIYRTTQESLTNITRLANAHHVDVTLRDEKMYLMLTIEEDGIGLEPDTTEALDSIRLSGIREMVSLIGGSVQMNSQPEKGTTLTLLLPMNQGEQDSTALSFNSGKSSGD